MISNNLSSDPTLAQLLNNWSTDVIYIYVKLLKGKTNLTRKTKRIDYICQQLLTPDTLQKHWHKLDPISKRAVSTAYHNGGTFSPVAFIAQYQEFPERPETDRYIYYHYENPILFDLFIINKVIPADLRPLLADLVLPEERFQITPVPENKLPTEMVAFSNNGTAPFKVVETETSGRIDLLTGLRMIEQKQIAFGSSNRLITAGSLKKLHPKLLDGDFVLNPDKLTSKYVIRPFGLTTFIYHSSFMTNRGNLSKSGQEYLKTQDPDLFIQAFEHWSENGRFEEISRIHEIKGHQSKKTKLTPPSERREKIIEALSWCPAEKWIHVNEFYRALLAWNFEIHLETTEDHNLSIEDSYWHMSRSDYQEYVVHPYIDIVLVEYLATLGLIDIAYADVAAVSESAYGSTDPSEIYAFFYYFRITPWGAYVFGISDDYTPVKKTNGAKFSITQTLQLTISEDSFPGDKLLVETIALPLGSNVYQLDTEKLLEAIQGGQSFEQLRTFLVAGTDTDVPELISWLDQLEQNSHAFNPKQKAVIYTVNATALKLIKTDAKLRQWAKPLDTKTILVFAGNDNKLRKRLKTLGYLIR